MLAEQDGYVSASERATNQRGAANGIAASISPRKWEIGDHFTAMISWEDQ